MNADTNNSSGFVIRQIVNLVAILAAFGINVYANINPPNGLTIGGISNQLFGNILITPANYAFAIWGIIYLGLISFAVYQVLPAQRNSILLKKLGYSIAIASLAQIIWVFAFLYRQFLLSLLLMLVILGALIVGYISIQSQIKSLTQKWLVAIPLSIYLGWISVATVVNVATVLEDFNWDGWGISPQVWTVIMLLVVGVIGVTIACQKNLAFTGVYLWALIAISLKNSTNTFIMFTAIIVALIIGLILLFNLIFKRDRPNKITAN